METRRLGRTGLSVPFLGLGTVKIGRNAGVKYPEPFDLPADEEVAALLGAALDEGVTFWDTAPAYGRSEARLGPWVRAHRARLFLSTKAGESFEDGVSRHDFSADAIRRSLEESLRRLRTDRVDLLLLHSDGNDLLHLECEETVRTLQGLRDEGLARSVGISAKTAAGVRAVAGRLDVVMAPFGIAQPELGPALAEAHDAGVGVVAIKVLGQGHALRGVAPEEVLVRSLDFVRRARFVDAVVIGTRKAEHLRQLCRTLQSLTGIEEDAES